MSEVTVALAEDSMWQSFLALRLVRKSLLQFTTVNNEVLLGFVTGLDEDWVQITTHQEMKAVLLSLNNLVSVKETGETLRSLQESGVYEVEDVRKIERYSQNTRNSASEFLEVKKREQQGDSR